MSYGISESQNECLLHYVLIWNNELLCLRQEEEIKTCNLIQRGKFFIFPNFQSKNLKN
jgi:hypothetical protein